MVLGFLFVAAIQQATGKARLLLKMGYLAGLEMLNMIVGI